MLYITEQDWQDIILHASPKTYIIRCFFNGRDIGYLGARSKTDLTGMFETIDINFAHQKSYKASQNWPDTIYQVEEKG